MTKTPILALASLLLTGTSLPGAYAASSPEACMTQLAQTRNGSLGQPVHATPTPDGKSVLFLRSGPRDTTLHLFRTDLVTKTTTELARAPDGPEHLSVEERAARERARQSLSGITDVMIAPDSSFAIAVAGEHLSRIELPTGTATPIPGAWSAPHLSPDGHQILAVSNDDLSLIDLATSKATQLTTGGSENLTHGLAEFAAAEELQRADGAWFSPDGKTVLYEEADSTGVEPHYIANLADPSQKPTEFRYPRTGTANAATRLGLIATQGGPTRWITWDHAEFPYIARVVWRQTGGLFVVLLNRAQTREQLLSIDPATAQATPILEDKDDRWLSLTPWEGSGGHALPVALPNGNVLWAAQRGPHWQLELHGHDGALIRALTPQSLPFVALNMVDAPSHSLIATVQTTHTDTAIVGIDLETGTITKLAAEPGVHAAHFTPGGHDVFVDSFDGADGTRQTILRHRDGSKITTLPSVAVPLDLSLHTQFLTAGAGQFDALVVRPEHFDPQKHYPVLLSVYAGPGYKVVWDAPIRYRAEQCLANQGFIVASLDGHGTPGRNHDFERATWKNLIDQPLADQVAGLQALGKSVPQMDLSRAGVYGWSFGGYFTAMATIRRPDVFKAGNAGAPPVEWTDYDTAYTERYLQTPDTDPDGYKISNVLTYAPNLSRPLLIMHGATDDNVYFANTMKLTQTLLRAGKPYELLLLPGTHMLPDPLIRARVDQARAAFFKRTLGGVR